jgi:RNA polymerase sigma-70 factor, ECF subfamily
MTAERVYREHYGRILATVIRLVGDFDRSEEAVQEAFAAALESWPRDGTPQNPLAWLVSTARHKAIDQIRREARFEARRDELERHLRDQAEEETSVDEDRLRLLFTCCHPALAPEAQVALTLRALCGFTTAEIARAFVLPVSTLAQRLVRERGGETLPGTSSGGGAVQLTHEPFDVSLLRH